MPETPDIPEELPLADVAVVPAEATSPLSDGETAESAETAHVGEALTKPTKVATDSQELGPATETCIRALLESLRSRIPESPKY